MPVPRCHWIIFRAVGDVARDSEFAATCVGVPAVIQHAFGSISEHGWQAGSVGCHRPRNASSQVAIGNVFSHALDPHGAKEGELDTPMERQLPWIEFANVRGQAGWKGKLWLVLNLGNIVGHWLVG